VGRVFVLEEGARRNLPGPSAVEEKIDGYNVRILRAGGRSGRLVAVVRSGYVCPFTTDRLPDLADLEPLFDEDPDLVLCAEVAGPENPYLHGQVPRVREDVALFAFDLMHLDRSGVLPVAEADAILDRHRLPRVPRLGVLEPGDAAGLREAALRLDAQGSEGMVLKPLAGEAGPDVVDQLVEQEAGHGHGVAVGGAELHHELQVPQGVAAPPGRRAAPPAPRGA